MQLPTLDKVTKIFERNPLSIGEAKEAGKKVVGTYCIYAPSELVLAIGAIPVSLCGTRQDAIPAAEKILPRTLCPLIKSSYGYLLNDSCPYLAAADFIVAETTCDGKKKMFELMAEDLKAKNKNILVMQLPSAQDEKRDLPAWVKEYENLADQLEKEFGVPVTRDGLAKAIDLKNRMRTALKRVLDTARHVPSPVSGMRLLQIANSVSFHPDKEEGTVLLNELADELEQVAARGQSPFSAKTPRILFTGVPTGMGSHKVVQLLEECGASVVCIDNCSVYKKTRFLTDLPPDATKQDMLYALARNYLDIPCSVLSPNPNRYSTLRDLAEKFSADAVVELTWQGCHTYAVEAYSVKKFVTEALGLPSLHLESDFSDSDTEQLRVRIEAFLELVSERKERRTA